MNTLENFTPPTPDEILRCRQDLELAEESRRRHRELVRFTRPTVAELRQQAVSVRAHLKWAMWNDVPDLLNFRPGEAREIIHFRHHVGDGLHYITNHPLVFASGRRQWGDTSEGCILNVCHLIEIRALTPSIFDLWTRAYPQDPMTLKDFAYIMASALAFTKPFVSESVEDITDALRDLRAIHCERLADLFEAELEKKGIRVESA